MDSQTCFSSLELKTVTLLPIEMSTKIELEALRVADIIVR